MNISLSGNGGFDLSKLGDSSAQLPTTAQPKAQLSKDAIDSAKLRQQLRYVAVSRATDTATIISTDVKKEGSPLHPEAEHLGLKELEGRIQEDSQKLRLSDNELYYIDEKGNKYARVTSVITTEETRFDPNSPWGLPSSNVGTGVDVFVRDFFDGKIGDPNTLAERYPNADQKSLRMLYDDLQKIKDKIEGKFTIISKDVTLCGQVPVTDKNGKQYSLNVAGTVDLLIYDNKGNFYIYDMKTHHSSGAISDNPAKMERYGKQVSMYKYLFERMYPGHNVKSLALMPIHVSYPAPKGWRDATAEYTVEGNNQLFVNGKEFRGANPTLEKTIPVTPQRVEIHYEDLTDDAKAVATPMTPQSQTNTLNTANSAINSDNQRSNVTKPQPKGFISDGARQLVSHLKSIGLNVVLREGMEKFLKEHPNLLVQQMVNKRKFSINNTLSEKEKGNIRTILKTINETGTTLLDDGEGNMYLLDHADREDIEKGKKNQEGFNCRLKFSTDGYSKEEINTIKDNIENGNIKDQRDFDKWSKTYLNKQRRDNSDSIVAEIRGTDGDNDNLYSRSSEGTSFRGRSNSSSSEDFGTGFIRVYGNDGTNGPRYIPINKDSGIESFTTPQGEVYGFVDKDGNIYLDETKINAEHPIHEYTHLWDRAVQQKNPDLWNRGVSLMRQTPLWNEVLNSDNYGKKWLAMGISQEKLVNLIASEAHSMLTGKKGAYLLTEIAKKQGKQGIVSKLKQWLLDFWNNLPSLHGLRMSLTSLPLRISPT